MIEAIGNRIGWSDLPGHVRLAVEGIIGAPVVSAASQPGGFSPGTAARVRTADHRRAFVKAVSPAQNDESPRMHRREGRVTAALPPGTPAPRLLGSYDDGDWIALVLEDIEGRQPVVPWRSDELALVNRTLDTMASILTPSPVPGLPTAAESLHSDFQGWRQVAQNPPADLDPWAADHLDDLVTLADRGFAALTGDTVVHLDVRADNLLIGSDGTVTVVDWPWAARGPRWLDRLLLLVNVRLYGGHDSETMLREYAAGSGIDPMDLRGVLAGLAGFFVHRGGLPPPPGIPTVRAFQRAQGEGLLAWLAQTW
jgi:aminoglycoside phosphotransferase (APT) family kinase protein